MEKSNSLSADVAFNKDNVKIPDSYSSEISITGEGTIIIKQPATGTTSKITDVSSAIEKLGAVYIPKGFVASTKSGEMTKEQGLVIYEGSDGNADVTTINQFVWIPVTDIGGGIERRQIVSDARWNMAWDNEWWQEQFGKIITLEDFTENIPKEMSDSINKYGGFYVGRYESSDDGNGLSTSRAGQSVWQGLVWADSEVVASNMYNSESSVVSHLMYGAEWDTIMQWVYDTPNNNVPGTKYIENSTGMGNFSGAMATTASNPKYVIKNMYDLAGNAGEWSMEICNNYGYSVRGSTFLYDPAISSVGLRGAYMESDSGGSGELSFRPSLYIK